MPAVTKRPLPIWRICWLSDNLHNRKPIALVGYTVVALAKPLIGLAAIGQQALGARFLDRPGTGVRSAPRDALIGSSADEENRGRAFGLEGAGDNLGAFLGPANFGTESATRRIPVWGGLCSPRQYFYALPCACKCACESEDGLTGKVEFQCRASVWNLLRNMAHRRNNSHHRHLRNQSKMQIIRPRRHM
jgi:hypothetical protein